MLTIWSVMSLSTADAGLSVPLASFCTSAVTADCSSSMFAASLLMLPGC